MSVSTTRPVYEPDAKSLLLPAAQATVRTASSCSVMSSASLSLARDAASAVCRCVLLVVGAAPALALRRLLGGRGGPDRVDLERVVGARREQHLVVEDRVAQRGDPVLVIFETKRRLGGAAKIKDAHDAIDTAARHVVNGGGIEVDRERLNEIGVWHGPSGSGIARETRVDANHRLASSEARAR
jgi:hypothetical protein